MSEALDLLWLPSCAALLLVGIHTYFGLQVLARGVIFVDLALAQIAALGATVAFMLGYAPQSAAAYAYSLAFTLAGAALLAATRSWAGRVSQEALIGVIYVVGAALAFLLVDRAPQGAEHIKQILTGNILVVSATDVLALIPLYVAVGIAHYVVAARTNTTGWWSELGFFASLGVVVTSSVALAGVLLVFSFLIMPAAIGMIFGDRFGRQLLLGWGAGVAASLVGLAISYAADLPTGATMVCTFGAALAIAGLVRLIRRGFPWGRVVYAVRWVAAIILVVAAIAIVAAPRADHPVLDVIERVAPTLRGLYLNGRENEILAGAHQDAARFQRESERLSAMEVASRADGAPIDDDKVRRIAAFTKSFNEMSKGEAFVVREVLVRARERNRWWLGAMGLCAALLIAPGFFSPAQLLRAWPRLRRRARPD
ncbi:MAG: metal ABC transporter permease [Burkholderiales bacterium]